MRWSLHRLAGCGAMNDGFRPSDLIPYAAFGLMLLVILYLVLFGG